MNPSDWFWEGNVQLAIQLSLEKAGWTIRSSADTASKAHGTDLLASLASRTLAVEVKGYPSTNYADPRRALETKKTNPINQAGHWYAQAVLKAMRMRSSLPLAEIAIGLPDFPRYRNLLADTEGSLRVIGVGVYLVAEPASVKLLIEHKAPIPPDEGLSPFDGHGGI